MKQEDKEEKGKRKSAAREVLDWIIYIGIVLLLSWLIITFVGVRTVVDGRSMEPTLHDGNNLIVDKLSYRFRDPKRYEIIVFPYKYEENTYYIKRIIGLPGETVQVKDGEVYIDGELLGEDYGAEPMEDAGIAAEPIQILDQLPSPLPLATMNILSWAITGTTARTAGTPVSEY